MLRPVSTICLLLSLASTPALAQSAHNRVHISRDMTVAAGQPARNVVCILCSARIEGPVDRDLAVFAGNVYIDGSVQGNVLDFGGRATLTGNARIGGSVLVFGGHLHQDPAAAIGRRRIVVSPIVFLPILLLLGVLIAGVILLLRLFYRGNQAPYPPLPRLRL